MSTTTRKIKRLREQATPKTVEACASFARKFNLSNYSGPAYESIDFFASRKLMCAQADVKWVTESLFQACIEEVEAAASSYMAAAARVAWKSTTKKGRA